MWLLYSSNERLFKHILSAHGKGFTQSHNSNADSLLAKKKVSAENLEAVRARFIEMYVHEKPLQSQEDLDVCGNFSRSHFILGTFDRALRLMEHYPPSSFHSGHLSAYVVSALVKHVDTMERVMCSQSADSGDCVFRHRQRIQQLVEKFNVCLV